MEGSGGDGDDGGVGDGFHDGCGVMVVNDGAGGCGE
jgi:hypothetical protein